MKAVIRPYLYIIILVFSVFYTNESYAKAVPVETKLELSKTQHSKKIKTAQKRLKKRLKKNKKRPTQMQYWGIGHTGLFIGGVLVAGGIAMLIVGAVMGLTGLWIVGLILALAFLFLTLCWLVLAAIFGFF